MSYLARAEGLVNRTLLNTQHYKVKIKVNWSNPGKGVVPSPTSWCSSSGKVSLRVILDYGCQLYLLKKIFFRYFAMIIFIKFCWFSENISDPANHIVFENLRCTFFFLVCLCFMTCQPLWIM